MAQAIRCTVLGGGSPFVHALLEGVAAHADRWRGGPELRVSLFDLSPERCARWQAYGRLLAQHHCLPLTVDVPDTRREALEAADLVLVSVGLREAERAAQRARETYGFPLHSLHDGPPAFAFSAVAWPLLRSLAEETAALSPGALLLVLPNPTDVLAEALEQTTGLRCAGICVEVPHTQEHLAYYWGVRPEEIVLQHAGVNHDGWVLRFTVRGEDGYARWAPRVLDLPQHPDFHPGNHGFVETYRLIGALRSSIYHNWPLSPGPYRGAATYESFRVSREARLAAVDAALAAGKPLDLTAAVAPERRWVTYLATGRNLSRLLWSLATGAPEVLPLQVRNRGAVTNLPEDVRVEVPTLAQGRSLQPLPVGELPEWLGGVTRLLALQRREAARYLVDGEPRTLRRALLTLPTVADLETLGRYAEEVRALRSSAEPSGA